MVFQGAENAQREIGLRYQQARRKATGFHAVDYHTTAVLFVHRKIVIVVYRSNRRGPPPTSFTIFVLW